MLPALGREERNGGLDGLSRVEMATGNSAGHLAVDWRSCATEKKENVELYISFNKSEQLGYLGLEGV